MPLETTETSTPKATADDSNRTVRAPAPEKPRKLRAGHAPTQRYGAAVVLAAVRAERQRAATRSTPGTMAVENDNGSDAVLFEWAGLPRAQVGAALSAVGFSNKALRAEAVRAALESGLVAAVPGSTPEALADAVADAAMVERRQREFDRRDERAAAVAAIPPTEDDGRGASTAERDFAAETPTEGHELPPHRDPRDTDRGALPIGASSKRDDIAPASAFDQGNGSAGRQMARAPKEVSMPDLGTHGRARESPGPLPVVVDSDVITNVAEAIAAALRAGGIRHSDAMCEAAFRRAMDITAPRTAPVVQPDANHTASLTRLPWEEPGPPAASGRRFRSWPTEEPELEPIDWIE